LATPSEHQITTKAFVGLDHVEAKVVKPHEKWGCGVGESSGEKQPGWAELLSWVKAGMI